ncbi:hypothetical protein ACTMU2_31755 [Cupriavidus basilensis]
MLDLWLAQEVVRHWGVRPSVVGPDRATGRYGNTQERGKQTVERHGGGTPGE